jgi:hypothetical protein
MAKLTTFLQARTTNCDMRGLVAIQAEKDRIRAAAEQAEAERKRQVLICRLAIHTSIQQNTNK